MKHSRAGVWEGCSRQFFLWGPHPVPTPGPHFTVDEAGAWEVREGLDPTEVSP